MVIGKCPQCKQRVYLKLKSDTAQVVSDCAGCPLISPAVPDEFDATPEFLYKYRPHDEHSASWIARGEVFFASPAMFNDPFDSKVRYSFEGTEDQIKKYFSKALDRQYPGIKKRKKWALIKKVKGTTVVDNEHVRDDHWRRMQERIDRYGVLSLSAIPNDILLFAYYGANHRGYYLKYKRAAENLLCLAEHANYLDVYPKFSALEMDFANPGAFGDKILLSKAQCWHHEKEWRIGVATVPKRCVRVDDLLVSITVGCDMSKPHEEEILALNQKRSKPVPIFKSVKKDFEFALDLVPLFS